MTVRFHRATQLDRREIADLLRATPMPGAVRLAYLREPEFFEALVTEGRTHDVMIARDEHNGMLVGLGVRSVKEAYVNGVPERVGYLSALRLHPDYRNGTLLARGYRVLHEWDEADPVAMNLTMVVDDNRRARDVLTGGRGNLPMYHPYGSFVTHAIATHQHSPAICPPDGVSIRRAGPADLRGIVAFLNEQGSRRQFFPVYRESDFAPTGLLRGLRIEDVFVAESEGRIVGTAALWDQRSFRQCVVTSYPMVLDVFRAVANGLLHLMGYPMFPKAGGRVEACCLALLCARDESQDVLRALAARALSDAKEMARVVLAGGVEGSPEQATLHRLRSMRYRSTAHVVCWPERQEAWERLDGRPGYLEMGAL
jgi:hypothetical protein